MKHTDLTGKLAVVTGAASGIGEAIARCFVEAGASVTLLDVNQERVQETASKLGEAATGVACDITQQETVREAFAGLSQVDILVNSAGIAHVGTLLSTSTADFDRLFDVNVRGTYLCMQAAVPRMIERRGGTILNMASIAATSGLPDRFAYSMTKGAVLSMTLSVARDYIDKGVRCNCISPARVHTPFVDGFVAKNYPGREAEMFEKLGKSQPIGRMGTPDEIALLALYLCSDASSFVTGCDYPIDGGFFNLR
jgi:2-keto-3-deoxy-L-fuconate dehydrogenase